MSSVDDVIAWDPMMCIVDIMLHVHADELLPWNCMHQTLAYMSQNSWLSQMMARSQTEGCRTERLS